MYIHYGCRKSGAESTLQKQISIIDDKEMALDDLIETIHRMIGDQIDSQTEYDNYGVAVLSGVLVANAYDREL